MLLFVDRDGAPLDTLEWARLYEQDGYRRVRWDSIDDDAVIVSTIWQGILGPWNQPFESAVMINGEIKEQFRWSSQSTAIAGHTELCLEFLGRLPV